MMDFGPTGSGARGNTSSSTSNLSALAPPFTVDRLNSKPNSNPNSHYPSSPYSAKPYSHGWEYSTPSAPIVFESSGMSNLPLPENCQFSATTTVSPTVSHWSTFSSGNKASSSTFSYGGEVKPNFSPYFPPLAEEESPLVEVDGSRNYKGPASGQSFKSQIDYTRSMWDVDCEAEWAGNLGLNDGKWAERVELEGSFFEKPNLVGLHSYGSQLNQGGLGAVKNKKGSNEGSSGSSNQIFNIVPDMGIHCGNSYVTQMEDKSCNEQNLGLFSYDSNKSGTSAYKFTYPEPHYSVPSSELHKNFSDDQNSSVCVKTIEKPFIGPVSAIMPSPTVVIRPPPANKGTIKKYPFASKKPTQCNNVESVQSVNFGPIPNSQFKEGSSETSHFNISNQEFLIPPTLLSSSLQSGDSLDRKCKAGLRFQSHDGSIYGGLNLSSDNNVQIVNSTENSVDFVVDSPCWKGASSSSQFSIFDIEAGNTNNFKKNKDECFGSNLEPHQKNLDQVTDFGLACSGKDGESNNNVRKHEPGAHCSSKDHSLLGDATCVDWTAKENETVNELNMPRKQPVLVNDLTSGFDMKNSDAKHLISEVAKMATLNDVTEGGYVAVHAAEKVLASPASQEDANGRIKEADRKLHVPTVLKAMHKLSELLMFHLSSESCSFEKEGTEALENIISNLNSCLQNKISETSEKPELDNPARDSSGKFRESCNLHLHGHEGNNSFSGKKDEKSPTLSPLMDGLDMSDDNMTKAIKKILDENFPLNEEIHSEATLFKNLWLDAEAKLCSIIYKARFDKMKIQMEQIRIKCPPENEDSEGILSEVCVLLDGITAPEVGPKGQHDGLIPKPVLQNSCISTTSGPADTIEASVMARFNILKSREECAKPIRKVDELEQPHDSVNGKLVDPIVARFNILKSREESSGKSIRMEDENRQSNKMNNAYENLDEFHLSVTNDPIVQSLRSNLGRRDSSSSDWEHVLNDDFSWRNF